MEELIESPGKHTATVLMAVCLLVQSSSGCYEMMTHNKSMLLY